MRINLTELVAQIQLSSEDRSIIIIKKLENSYCMMSKNMDI